MTAKGKREFWLAAAVITTFPAMMLFLAAIVDAYDRLRRLVADGTLPSIEQLMNEFSERLGLTLLLGVLGLTSWISCKKYSECAGLESKNEE